jgi:hypothetical protein
MLRFLMRDENLQIVKVSFTVVAPRTRQDLLDVGMIPLLLPHDADTSKPVSNYDACNNSGEESQVRDCRDLFCGLSWRGGRKWMRTRRERKIR